MSGDATDPDQAASKPSARLSSGDMHAGPGLRVRHRVDRLHADVVDAFRQFPTPDVSDQLNRLYTMNTAIRQLTAGDGPLVGTACTVKVFPGDNLMVHKALDVAAPGDVVVVDTSGSTMTAVLGDMIATKARHRGIGGFVIDGLVRDLPGILALGDLPVFARGVTPIGPLHRGPGEINHPVSCGGIVVRPGDLIVADANGVVVVPQDVAPAILFEMQAKAEKEGAYAAAVARGEFSNEWVDRVLADAGMELEQPGSPPGPA